MRLTILPAALLALALAGPATAEAPAPSPWLSQPGLSPDGREIAFVSGGDIWTVPAAGGDARLLVAHPPTESRPLYSPDGRALAFVSDRTGNGDIYVLTLATGRAAPPDLRRRHRAARTDGRPTAAGSTSRRTSRDIAGMNDVFRVRAAGGTPMPVSAERYMNEFVAAPSPDGTRC